MKPSIWSLNGWLLAILGSSKSAQATPLENRDSACLNDNLLNKLHNTPAVYIPFCQTYLSLASYQTVTVTSNFASTPKPASTVYPPALTSSSYPADRLSSACSCMSVPRTSQTVTAYISSKNTASTSSSAKVPTITGTAASTPAAQASIPAGFSKILFEDDFSKQSPGSLPSSSKWSFTTGTSYPGGPARFGNNEWETYTQSTDNVVITSDGTLRITPLNTTGHWTSARIETQAALDFSCPAGGKLRIEASIKLGAGAAATQQGIWPAFWMLGSAFRGNYTNWPSIGEIDMLEAINGQTSIHHGVHCGNWGGGPCNEPNGLGKDASFTRGAFHTVSVDIDRTSLGGWSNETLVWNVDGTETWRIAGSKFGSEDVWDTVGASAKYILLNVAVGGNWPGAPNAQTVGGIDAAMDVKYVAVYSS